MGARGGRSSRGGVAVRARIPDRPTDDVVLRVRLEHAERDSARPPRRDGPSRRCRAGAGLAGRIRQAAARSHRRGVRQPDPRYRCRRPRRGVRGERRRPRAHRVFGGRADRELPARRAGGGAAGALRRPARAGRVADLREARCRAPAVGALHGPGDRGCAASTASPTTTSRGSGRCPSASRRPWRARSARWPTASCACGGRSRLRVPFATPVRRRRTAAAAPWGRRCPSADASRPCRRAARRAGDAPRPAAPPASRRAPGSLPGNSAVRRRT